MLTVTSPLTRSYTASTAISAAVATGRSVELTRTSDTNVAGVTK
ncbi:MAG: hypothetical protein WCH00_00610 [Candidatus Saccharibacteria bacterium]